MTSADLDKISRRLKSLRDELGRMRGGKMAQRRVAEELKVPARTFQAWENGEVATSRMNYSRIADYYTEQLGREIDVDLILFGGEPPADPPAASLTRRLDRIESQLVQLLAAAGLDPLDAAEIDARRLSARDPREPPADEGGRRDPESSE